MNILQVVIPMAGVGDRFRKAGYTLPKPLLDVAGQPLIERLLRKFPKESHFVFILNEAHDFEDLLKRLAPGCVIVKIAGHKKGPVHTVWAGEQGIDDKLPTLVNYCDFSFVWDADHFSDWMRRGNYDGGIFAYRGFHPHYLRNYPYAYCREEGGRVLEVREKGHFTADRQQEYASSGTYYFSSGALLKKYVQRTLAEEPEINGERYMSVVYNPMIRDGLRIQVYEIPFFLQWGTPEDLEDYLYWHRAFDYLASWTVPDTPEPSMHVVMPMAGRGSRFHGSAALPKPLIPVMGRPMFLQARHFLPRGQNPATLVLLSEFKDAVRAADQDSDLIAIAEPTQGQADTTALGLAKIQPQESVLVSACDHGLLWDAAAWQKLLAQKPDLIIVGQRGYPGARRTPNAFSYIAADADGRLTQVSVKKPLTAEPHKELVLVGTFYFASAALLQRLIGKLKSADLRVNGERYLDSVVAVALEERLDVRAFEAHSYLNWGTPEALAEFNYWHRYFLGAQA